MEWSGGDFVGRVKFFRDRMAHIRLERVYKERRKEGLGETQDRASWFFDN